MRRTGIGNRQALRQAFDRLEKQPGEQTVYLAMLDMDHFKHLNDTYGHCTGDCYLQGLAKVLHMVCPEKTASFRFGGD